MMTSEKGLSVVPPSWVPGGAQRAPAHSPFSKSERPRIALHAKSAGTATATAATNPIRLRSERAMDAHSSRSEVRRDGRVSHGAWSGGLRGGLRRRQRGVETEQDARA